MRREVQALGGALISTGTDIADSFFTALAAHGALALLQLLGFAVAVVVGVGIGARRGRGSAQELGWKIAGGVCGFLLAVFASFVVFQTLR